jgi:DNA-binding winged helix-turn-helix (wHTH) protein/TolB-like protein/Flp pilus assembly protein TadD
MSEPAQRLYEFGGFELDARERVLRRDGQPVQLTPKAFDTLLVLVECSGHVVTKDELIERVWPDSFVEEGNLAFNISVLRKALSESGGASQLIETVPKRGYRFKAGVRRRHEASGALVIEQQTTAHIVIEEVKEDAGPADAQASAADSRPATTRAARLMARLKQRRVALAIAVIVIGLGLYITFRMTSAPTRKTIAVLPFKPLAADAGDQYLELGMADALITRLSNIQQIIVRPTGSIIKYAAGPQDALAAGRELGVATVLDGSIQRIGDRLRITVRLMRVSDGAPLWADQYDEHFTSIFDVQDSISQRMADALALRLTGDEQKRLTRRYTENPAAYEAYLKGRYYWARWNGEALTKSLGYFEQAINADPQYALAYAGLADSYNVLGYLGIAPAKEAYPKCEAAARQALALDDSLSEAHLMLAKVKLFYDWDRSGFESEIARALALDPNDADAHSTRGTYLQTVGRFDEAISERKRGHELDPLSPLLTTGVAWAYYYARRYDEAIEWYKKSIELDPNFVQAQTDLGMAYLMKGRVAEAFDQLVTARAISGAAPGTIDALRRAYQSAGITGYWQKELELANAQAGQRPPASFRLARIYTQLGDRDRAFEWLEKAYAERNSVLIFLKVNPQFDSLHADPRFADLLHRIGLE